FAGSLSPRPPETTIGASATSSVPAGAVLICFTTTRPAAAVTAAVSAAPARGRCTGVKTLGRSDTTAGFPVSLSLRSALPAYTGWMTVTAPPPSSPPTAVAPGPRAPHRPAPPPGARPDRAAEAVREPPRPGDDLQRHLPQGAVALLEHREHGAHRTFASSRSSRISSGTAAGPSPTIFPSLRSGGGSRATSSRPPLPSDAGLASRGLRFAAMMPLSAG